MRRIPGRRARQRTRSWSCRSSPIERPPSSRAAATSARGRRPCGASRGASRCRGRRGVGGSPRAPRATGPGARRRARRKAGRGRSRADPRSPPLPCLHRRRASPRRRADVGPFSPSIPARRPPVPTDRWRARSRRGLPISSFRLRASRSRVATSTAARPDPGARRRTSRSPARGRPPTAARSRANAQGRPRGETRVPRARCPRRSAVTRPTRRRARSAARAGRLPDR